MIYSMTGFSTDVYTDEKYVLEIEVRSLNSRFLDLSLRMPKELNQFEYSVRDLIKSKLVRGKVSVNINFSLNMMASEDSSLKESELLRILDLLNKIKAKSNISEEVSLNQLLLFRENFIDNGNSGFELDEEILMNTLSKAVDNLIEMRGKEGKELKKDIELRLQNVETKLSEIEKLAQASTGEYFEKFKEKVKKLYSEFVDDENRFLLELGILSEKHDVTEECIRLKSHIKLFNNTLSKQIDIGRKLNFICQEMNREVNTINSKSISSEISHIGINIKEELEKIREQVQNVE